MLAKLYFNVSKTSKQPKVNVLSDLFLGSLDYPRFENGFYTAIYSTRDQARTAFKEIRDRNVQTLLDYRLKSISQVSVMRKRKENLEGFKLCFSLVEIPGCITFPVLQHSTLGPLADRDSVIADSAHLLDSETFLAFTKSLDQVAKTWTHSDVLGKLFIPVNILRMELPRKLFRLELED